MTEKSITNTNEIDTLSGWVNQDVRNTASPTFVNLDLTGVTQDNTQSNILTLNGSHMLNTRLLSSLNPFNQNLNTTNSPTFVSETLSGQLNLTGLSNQIVIGIPTSGLTTTISCPPPTGASITLTLPFFSSDTFSVLAAPQTFTNKSIESTTNTITVNSTNINSILNQPVLTTSSPTFANITDSGLSTNAIVTTNGSSELVSTQLTNNQIMIGVTSGPPAPILLLGSTNEVTISNTGADLIFTLPQQIGTTSSVTFGTLNIGSVATTTLTNALIFNSAVQNRKIVLFQTADNDNQIYGFGVAAGVLRYNVGVTTASHIFYAGASTSTSNTLFTIFGNGNGVSLPGSTNASYDIGSGQGTFAVANAANAYFAGTASGDMILRNASQKIHIGNNGSINAQLVVSTSGLTITGYISGSGATSIAGGSTSVLGSTGSVNITGTNVGGNILVSTAGTAPSASGVMATITLPIAAPIATFPVILFPANSSTALIATSVYANATSTTTFTISTGTTLPNTQNYSWSYHIMM